MPTDLQAVRDSLIKVAGDSVGYLLSTIPGPNGTTYPAVLKSRKKFTSNPTPFVVLDLSARSRQGPGNLVSVLNEEFLTESEAHYDFLFSYTVIGGDAFRIASELESAFRQEAVIIELLNDGVYLVDTEDVIADSDVFGGEFTEIARFTLVVTIPDITVRNEGCINDIEFSGELFRHPDDPNPTPIEVNNTNN